MSNSHEVVTPHSRNVDRPSCAELRPSKIRGRRECRAPAAPAALCAKTRSTQAKSLQVQHGQPGIPRASGFNGFLRALPGVHDVLVTVIGAMQSIVANLAPAKGRQDHTTSPSASTSLVRQQPTRPSHPAPYTRDDREAPLLSSAGRLDKPLIWGRDHCGRLARRAICGWHACANWPSGIDLKSALPIPDQIQHFRRAFTHGQGLLG